MYIKYINTLTLGKKKSEETKKLNHQKIKTWEFYKEQEQEQQ